MRLLFLLSSLVLISACQQQTLTKYQETIAGIDHSLWIYDSDADKAKRAISATFSELRLLSNFTDPIKSKPISRTNVLLRSREWFSVNPSLTHILKRSIEYYKKTNGLYNPVALGALRQQWGFYVDTGKPTAPKEKDLQLFLADLPTMHDIEFDSIRLIGKNNRMRLDFDYLAYGDAIDIEMKHLKELGIKNARLRIGPVERIIGTVIDGDITPLVGNIKPGQSACRREILLTNEENDNPVLHNIIDPKTGHPIDHTNSVTVVAQNARDASVACWALMVSTPDTRQDLMGKLDLIQASVTDAEGKKYEYFRK